ncbi:TIGR03943 family putative permease subunit [Stenomitos frigidus]|uniref:TIGR03943 family protein n=1 Tax=Stenomitos frigidus ULC18 TaxID=2107698 RepID=A0A2T1E388_9CYAN|nr:TIGR03943 family protein [Stenomitos frigidus]PSB27207.1 TIGR03943 family protein [Stenomitos frigidus ULC18]
MSLRSPRSPSFQTVLPWLDVVAIAAWGILFLKYWLTGKLNLLIHPNYMGLTIVAGVVLLLVSGIKATLLYKQRQQSVRGGVTERHLTLFPPGWSTVLLLGTAILGLLISPRAFASQTAIDRGVNDTVTLTRVKPQAFRAATNSDEKTLVDWVRTLAVYPEPDAYTGQKAKVQGFVVYPQDLPNDYLLLSRFVITCCAADVYPVSLPVKLSQSRDAYKPDTWLEIEGQMMTAERAGKRQLAIAAKTLKPIPEPKNPYDY